MPDTRLQLLVIIVATICWTTLATAGSISSTAGGVKLTLAENTGRLHSVQIHGNEVASPNLFNSGFSLRDYATKDGFVPLTGPVIKARNSLMFIAMAAALRFQARIKPLGLGWEITGTVRRTGGGERFLSLRFAVPVIAEGWKWWDTILRTRPLSNDKSVTNTRASKLGSGGQDLLPFSAISCNRGGLGYAVRMDEQWFHQTLYEQGLYCFVLDFALLNGQKHFSTEVPFRFYLFAPEGLWGLRGLLASYYKLFPKWGLAAREARYPGAWCGGGVYGVTPWADLGQYYIEEAGTSSEIERDEITGSKTLPYIEACMYQQYHGDMNCPPTAEEAWARLEHNARAVGLADVQSNRDRAWVRDISAAILQSPIMDAEGKRRVAYSGNWPWIGGTNYGAQFPLNLDPDIPEGVGQERLDECRKQIADPRVDGMYLDSYSDCLTEADYNPTNVSVSRTPPTFNSMLKPCVLTWAPSMMWVQELRKMMGSNQHCILANSSLNAPSPWHSFDVIGKEWWVEAITPLMAAHRAVSYHKVVSMLGAGFNPGYWFIKQQLLLDIIPGGNALAAKPPEVHAIAEIYRRLTPLFRLLHRLGWQPITQAVALQENVYVERYGQSGGPIAFVIVNTREPRVVEVSIDAQALGITHEAWCSDPLDEIALSWRWERGRFVASAALANEGTVVLVVGPTRAQAQFQTMWAADSLEVVGLLLREYELRQKKPHPLAAQAGELRAKAQPQAIARIREFAEALKPDESVTAHAGELARAAVGRLQASFDLKPAHPQPLNPPVAQPIGQELPWTVEFDQPLNVQKYPVDRRYWKASGNATVENGELVLRDPGGSISYSDYIEFATRPIEIEYRFRSDTVAPPTKGEWFHGAFVRLQAETPDPSDYLNIRINYGSQIRLENGETPPSNYQKALFDYHPLEPNVWHTAKLRLDVNSYRLEIDGKVLGQGPHRMTFIRGKLILSMYTAPVPQGNVFRMDYIRIRPAAQ
jgi:hypothetical protein